MSLVQIGENKYDVELVVFDKDGLLFESKPFWIELAYERAATLENYLTQHQIKQWLDLMRVSCELVNGKYIISDIDPIGIIAVASPHEEIFVTATFLVEHANMCWTHARDVATQIFEQSDRDFRLEKSLVPTKGFPKIFQRLLNANIPYGIATSDDFERAKRSVDGFILKMKLLSCGKN